MDRYFLGFDIGSSSCKCTMMDTRGQIASTVSREIRTQRTQSGMAEQDPRQWWTGFKDAIGHLLSQTGIEARQIAAVGITGFVPGLVAVDDDGNVVRPCIMHTDTRAGRELRELVESSDRPLSMGMLLPKLIWFRNTEPSQFAAARRLLSPHSYLVFKLTDRATCDHDTASITGLVYDRNAQNWDSATLRSLDVDVELFPPLADSHDVAGPLSAHAAAETGLEKGTPVIVGTGDSMASLLGNGAFAPGCVMIYLGTSGTRIHVRRPLIKILSGVHFAPGRAEFIGTILSCGESMEHFGRILGFSDWAIPDAEALKLPPSTNLYVTPHSKQKGADSVSFHNRESVIGLLHQHGPYHIYRALLEGIAFNIRTDFPAESPEMETIILCGGGANSEVFCRIISDVLNRTIKRNRFGSASLGIAFLAALGCGMVTDEHAVAEQWSAMTTTIRPNPSNANHYSRTYPVFRQLTTQMDRLDEFIEGTHLDEAI